MRPLLLAYAGLLTHACVTLGAVHPLADERWTVTNEHRNITVPGHFPSQVHVDLYAAGVIGKSFSELKLTGLCVV